jgi:hypothetical protein
MGGGRNSSGSLIEVGNDGYYWSSTISGTSSVDLAFGNGDAQIFSNPRVLGLSVRCIKN